MRESNSIHCFMGGVLVLMEVPVQVPYWSYVVIMMPGCQNIAELGMMKLGSMLTLFHSFQIQSLSVNRRSPCR